MKDNNNQDNNKQSFLEKMKTDKKYKAKVELIAYAVVVVIIIVYLNISNIGNNYEYNKVLDNKDKDSSVVDDEKEKVDSLEKLNDNYNYKIDIDLKRIKEGEVASDSNVEEIKYGYSGKANKENLVIEKNFNNITDTYYKIDDEYYIKEGEEYNVVDSKNIYELLDGKYIELDNVKEYIELASLDHVTNYSSGKKEYVYNLKVSDVIKSYKEDDLVEINIIIEDSNITMKINYSNLLKQVDTKIVECNITYTYTDINNVENFVIFEDEDNNEEE